MGAPQSITGGLKLCQLEEESCGLSPSLLSRQIDHLFPLWHRNTLRHFTALPGSRLSYSPSPTRMGVNTQFGGCKDSPVQLHTPSSLPAPGSLALHYPLH